MSPDFDRLIDHAAGRLTAGEPSSDLRRRVLSRLPERRRTNRLFAVALPAAAALAAVLLIGVILVRRPSVVAPGAGVPATNVAAASQSTARSADPVNAGAAVTRIADTPRTASRRPALVDDPAWRERAVPALPLPDGLAIPAIQPDAITIPQLHVEPLVVGTLTPPGEGSGGGR